MNTEKRQKSCALGLSLEEGVSIMAQIGIVS